MSSGSSGLGVFLLGVGAGLAVVTAAGAAAVKLDAVAGTGDAIALTGAARRTRGNAGWAGAVGAAGAGEGWDIRVNIRIVIGLLIDVGVAEAGGELIDGGLVVALGDDAGGLDWVVWLGALDVGGGDTAAMGNVLGGAARGALGVPGGGLAGASWHIEDVELALGGWLKNGLLGWVMCAVVPIHDVVVPVALTLLESATSEAESASPVTSRLGRVDRERKLTLVVVP